MPKGFQPKLLANDYGHRTALEFVLCALDGFGFRAGGILIWQVLSSHHRPLIRHILSKCMNIACSNLSVVNVTLLHIVLTFFLQNQKNAPQALGILAFF